MHVSYITLAHLVLMAMLAAPRPIYFTNFFQVISCATTKLCTAMDNGCETDEPSFETERKELLKLTNEERKNAGVPPLTSNSKLQAAANQHSKNMAKQEKLVHELDDKNPSDRVKELNYKFQALAENIAEGEKSAGGVIKLWMASEAHRTNLLNPDYTEIGLGSAESAQGVRYWTQVFAKPRK